MPAKVMVDYNPIIKALLIAATPVTALVSARVLEQFPATSPTFPLVTYAVIDNFHADSDYFENLAQAEQVQVEIQCWNQKATSPMAVAIAVDTAMAADGWNRQYSQGFVETGTGYKYNVARYTKRFR
jgi:hypothetical protein